MNIASIPIDENGRFSGYAAIFNRPDQGGDIIKPGAFRKSLANKKNNPIKLLFQHDPKEPVGIWENICEDGFGLWVQGRLLPKINRARELKNLINNGAIDGLSIGFKTEKARRDRISGYRYIFQLNLWEISIVTFPMMEGARIKPNTSLPANDNLLARSLDAAISLLRNQ